MKKQPDLTDLSDRLSFVNQFGEVIWEDSKKWLYIP